MAVIFFVSGGSGSFSTRDHQAPSVIVGNEANGDTADVCDFLVPTFGSADAMLNAAIDAANAVRGDIWIRAGRYPVTAALHPLSADVIVRGAGRVATLFDVQAGNFLLFDMANACELLDFQIRARLISGAGSSNLVKMRGGGNVERVVVQSESVDAGTAFSEIISVEPTAQADITLQDLTLVGTWAKQNTALVRMQSASAAARAKIVVRDVNGFVVSRGRGLSATDDTKPVDLELYATDITMLLAPTASPAPNAAENAIRLVGPHTIKSFGGKLSGTTNGTDGTKLVRLSGVTYSRFYGSPRILNPFVAFDVDGKVADTDSLVVDGADGSGLTRMFDGASACRSTFSNCHVSGTETSDGVGGLYNTDSSSDRLTVSGGYARGFHPLRTDGPLTVASGAHIVQAGDGGNSNVLDALGPTLLSGAIFEQFGNGAGGGGGEMLNFNGASAVMSGCELRSHVDNAFAMVSIRAASASITGNTLASEHDRPGIVATDAADSATISANTINGVAAGDSPFIELQGDVQGVNVVCNTIVCPDDRPGIRGSADMKQCNIDQNTVTLPCVTKYGIDTFGNAGVGDNNHVESNEVITAGGMAYHNATSGNTYVSNT